MSLKSLTHSVILLFYAISERKNMLPLQKYFAKIIRIYAFIIFAHKWELTISKIKL